PDWILKEAREVVLVDLPPRALLNRLARGVVYPPEKAAHALDHFFKEPTLAALREMALRHAAHEVDLRQEDGLASPSSLATEPGEAREKVLIHVTDDPSTAALIRRGRRVADYLRGECFAVAVLPPGTTRDRAPARPPIDEHLSFARRLHIETHVLEAADVA